MNLKINWRENHTTTRLVKKYLTTVLDSDALTQGPQKKNLKKFKFLFKSKKYFCTSSAASALEQFLTY